LTVHSAARLPLVLLGISAPLAAQASGYICDQPVPQEPPIGCSWWGENLSKGYCESYASTGGWHCPTGWYPTHEQWPPTHAKNLAAVSLPLPSELALAGADTYGRALRLLVDTQRLGYAPGRQVPILELLTMESPRQGVTVVAERDSRGGFELVVRAINEKASLARLPLRDGSSNVMIDWRLDPRDGPRLRLSAGRSAAIVGLHSLDASTILQLWQSYGAEPRFDVSFHAPTAKAALEIESLPLDEVER
jgi:hypothetical protein